MFGLIMMAISFIVCEGVEEKNKIKEIKNFKEKYPDVEVWYDGKTY